MKAIGTVLVVLALLAPAAMAAVPAPVGAPMATAAGQKNLNLVVADDSKIIKNGNAVALSDLKQGDKVTITYRPEAGKNLVVNIGVESKT